MDVWTTIELNVGEVYPLRLSSLSTSGYVWNYAIEGNAELIKVTAERAGDLEQPDQRIVGSSADEQFIILAEKPGEVLLHLTQQRPWETNQPPLKQYTVEVKIQSGRE